MKKFTLLLVAILSSFTMFSQAPKRVVVEDFTGTWCGYCPRGQTTLESIVNMHPTTIGMEVHDNDTYANTYSNAVITGINPSGFPTGAIDRFAFGGSTSAFSTTSWMSKAMTRSSTSTPVAVDFTSTYNTSTKALSVTVTAKFVAAASGDLRISCVLAEDGVVTTSDPQHNYMGNGCSSPDPASPWYTYPCSITNYTHNGVARVNLAPTFGTSGVIPSSVIAGSTYTTTYTYTLPATWGGTTPNPSKIYIVAFVGKYGTSSTSYEILNANKSLIGTNTILTGVVENKDLVQLESKQSYPNPFSDISAISFNLNVTDNVVVKIYDMLGTEINTIVNTKLIPGNHTVYWAGENSDGSTVPGGVYFYTVSTSLQHISGNMIFIK
jgi:thiol-disulfide isomerase/thioredoxin